MKFPQLETERLNLKEIHSSDSQAVFEIFSNAAVVKYYDIPPLEDPARAEELINFFQKRYESESGIRWGIFLKGQSQCIGTCGFNSWDKNMHSTNIGYELNKSFWQHGIMSEALNRIIALVYSNNSPFYYINRIQADTIPGNIASEKVLLKLGFKEEGLRRQSGFWKQQYHDLKCFGLLRDDFIRKV